VDERTGLCMVINYSPYLQPCDDTKAWDLSTCIGLPFPSIIGEFLWFELDLTIGPWFGVQIRSLPRILLFRVLLSGVEEPPLIFYWGYPTVLARAPNYSRSLLFYLTRLLILKLDPCYPAWLSEDIWVLTVESGGSDRESEEAPFSAPNVEFLY